MVKKGGGKKKKHHFKKGRHVGKLLKRPTPSRMPKTKGPGLSMASSLQAPIKGVKTGRTELGFKSTDFRTMTHGRRAASVARRMRSGSIYMQGPVGSYHVSTDPLKWDKIKTIKNEENYPFRGTDPKYAA